ncbi:hypothetical protein A1OE_873 [Candidatus Endolissoclinum faulkneri L2]|uniref:Uncharacterized protein n=1 Tax=Candidatus Endolissoclinum faulkneri L2 TaxID=1193729 RepID=K7YNG4_9PROT|nr:hypothetical protein A1OE_873 [Candidatus Endolissoclinum faulkneri L2]
MTLNGTLGRVDRFTNETLEDQVFTPNDNYYLNILEDSF